MQNKNVAVVIALAVLAIVIAPPAAAGAAEMASASWHGRAIQDPQPRPQLGRTTWPAGWNGGAVARGSGYELAEGSPRVRDIQRRLRQLGYRPGPVDGLFGPRTEAAVRWFQYKHGLRRTGEANRSTLTVLRARSEHRPLPTRGDDSTRTGAGSRGDEGRAESRAGARGDEGRAQSRGDEAGAESRSGARGDEGRVESRGDEAAGAPSDARRVAAETGEGDSAGDVVLLIIAVLLALIAGLLVGTHGLDPFRRREPQTPQAPPPPATHVFGYVTRNSPLHVNTAIAALAALCERRGWTLVRIVHDPEPASGRLSDRAGLMYALREIRAGVASGLVVARLQDVGTNFPDLAALVQWLTDAEAFFAAAGRELDTSTSTGRATADAIIELGTRHGHQIASFPTAGRLRVPVHDPELGPRLTALRERGIPLGAIADALNVARIPTATGHHHWRLADVRAVTYNHQRS
jgi:peptidoglycan hydrolase-like protein with peptidoglycan-binding domain